MKKNSISEKHLGSARGIRTPRECERNKNIDLSAESVGFQHLSLRHSTPGNISLFDARTTKIRSYWGLIGVRLLTGLLVRWAKLVSLRPIVSEPHDFLNSVRNRKLLFHRVNFDSKIGDSALASGLQSDLGSNRYQRSSKSAVVITGACSSRAVQHPCQTHAISDQKQRLEATGRGALVYSDWI